MNNEKLNNLVGKSFEDLSIEEMEELQGAAGSQVNSTVVIPISTIEVSEAVSTLASIISASVVSYVASKAKKCTK